MSNLKWSDEIAKAFKDLAAIPGHLISDPSTAMQLKILQKNAEDAATDNAWGRLEAEIERRDKMGGPANHVGAGGSDPRGYYMGYPVSDLLANMPMVDQVRVIKKMAHVSFPAGVAGGFASKGIAGGGAGGAGNYTSTPFFDHANAIATRMRWPSGHQSPFGFFNVHAIGGKVFVFIITKDLKTVTLEAEDDGLFPSDHLITELRLLAG